LATKRELSAGTRCLLEYTRSLRPLLRTDEERHWLEEYEDSVVFFREHFTSMVRDHAGKYVALLGAMVVDSDEDELALAKRVHDKFGDRPICMPFAGTRAGPPKRMGGPRPPRDGLRQAHRAEG